MVQKCLKRGKSPLIILDENEPKTTMTVYLIFAKEDKCQVSKEKHEDRRKMEYFRETINST